jgi:hypothetical protein
MVAAGVGNIGLTCVDDGGSSTVYPSWLPSSHFAGDVEKILDIDVDGKHRKSRGECKQAVPQVFW